MKKLDILLLCGILLAAAALWLVLRPGGEGAWAVVSVDGEISARYPLDVDRTVTIGEGNYNVLQISDGQAAVIDANCGDLTCVHMGRISRQGESIVCLPHRLVISISGGETSGFDAVSE